MFIRVKNLVPEISISDIQKLFAGYGKVTSISLAGDREAPFGTRHIASVEMPLREEGLSAIKSLDGTSVKDIPISVAEITAQQ